MRNPADQTSATTPLEASTGAGLDVGSTASASARFSTPPPVQSSPGNESLRYGEPTPPLNPENDPGRDSTNNPSSNPVVSSTFVLSDTDLDDDPPGLYPIGVVCDRLDINPVTLRAWERRYGLISPTRTAKGHRLYSDDDIDRIRSILELVGEGIPISQVARALERREALRAAATQANPSPDDAQASRSSLSHDRTMASAIELDLSNDPAARALFDAIAKLDLDAFHRVLHQLRLRLDWTSLYLDVIPRLYDALLHGIKSDPEAEARLTLIGSWLSGHLLQELQSIQFVYGGPTVIFGVFGSGHRRIPGLILASATARIGLRVVLLDDVVSARALQVLTRHHRPCGLILHVSSQIVRSPQNQQLEDILENCRLTTLLAGNAARGLAQIERQPLELPRDTESRSVVVLPDDTADAIIAISDSLGLSQSAFPDHVLWDQLLHSVHVRRSGSGRSRSA
ncbi:MAG: MerR family transcriptional regulator [Thioalkalivibrionaceae bacterium]